MEVAAKIQLGGNGSQVGQLPTEFFNLFNKFRKRAKSILQSDNSKIWAVEFDHIQHLSKKLISAHILPALNTYKADADAGIRQRVQDHMTMLKKIDKLYPLGLNFNASKRCSNTGLAKEIFPYMYEFENTHKELKKKYRQLSKKSPSKTVTIPPVSHHFLDIKSV